MFTLYTYVHICMTILVCVCLCVCARACVRLYVLLVACAQHHFVCSTFKDEFSIIITCGIVTRLSSKKIWRKKIWRNSPAGQIISSKIILELLWAYMYQAKMCHWHIFSLVLLYTGMKKASFVLTIIKRTKESRRRLSTTLKIMSLKRIEFTPVASKEYDFCTSSFT